MRGVHGGPPRFTFLDGMRGLTALYIVLHHAALTVPPRGLSGGALVIRFALRHGHAAVAVFIVLSGFCLMNSALANPGGVSPGGFWRYLGRRARRILPPYYAALAFCWLIVALVPALAKPSHSMWDRSLPTYEGGVVASHLLLIHNLSPQWIFKVQPPLWSVATEWQIYLFFPMLLALWKRFGSGQAVNFFFARRAGGGTDVRVAAALSLVSRPVRARNVRSRNGTRSGSGPSPAALPRH